MVRFAWLMVVLACLSFAGCGGDDAAKTDAKTDSAATGVEDDLKKAGITEEEYARQLEKQRQ